MCPRPSQNSPLRSNDCRIAVVDDDLDVLSSLRFLLETEGFEVCTFRTAASLLEAPLQVDCYVLDYKMEPISGVDLAREIRERDSTAAIVIITGYPNEEIQSEARSVGIYSVLLKPHLEEALTPAILAATAARRAL